MVVLSLRFLSCKKEKKKSPECRKKRKRGKFFLKVLGIQSTVSHLRTLTSLEIRVFLNPSLLQEHGAWVRQAGISVLSKELIWQMSQTTQKARVYLTSMAQQGPSPSLQTYAAVYAAELVSGGFSRCRFPAAPFYPWAASFPHHGCFHAPSSHVGLLEAVSPPQLPREGCNLKG